MRLEVHGGSVVCGRPEVHGRRHRRGLERRRLVAGHGWRIEVARCRRWLDVERLQHSPIRIRSPGCRWRRTWSACTEALCLHLRRNNRPTIWPGAIRQPSPYLLEVVLELVEEAHRAEQASVAGRCDPAEVSCVARSQKLCEKQESTRTTLFSKVPRIKNDSHSKQAFFSVFDRHLDNRLLFLRAQVVNIVEERGAYRRRPGRDELGGRQRGRSWLRETFQ